MAYNKYFELTQYYDPVNPINSTVVLRMENCSSCEGPCGHTEKQKIELPAYMWEAIRQQPAINLHIDQNDEETLENAVDLYEDFLAYFKDPKYCYKNVAYGIDMADDRDKNINIIFNELKKKNEETLETIKKIEEFKKTID